MTLAELISRIEQQTGTSITDPALLNRRVMIGADDGDWHITHVEILETDIILGMV